MGVLFRFRLRGVDYEQAWVDIFDWVCAGVPGECEYLFYIAVDVDWDCGDGWSIDSDSWIVDY